MKPSDFRPEHFEKGQSFNKTDFNAYIQASEALSKTTFTRYFPCIIGGILLGVLFRGAGGFAGNMLSVVCIFGGLIIGGVFNIKASKNVKACASRLGITKVDVAKAQAHVKNGTFAWTGNGDEEGSI